MSDVTTQPTPPAVTVPEVAQVVAKSLFNRALDRVPVLLAHKVHIVFLGLLGLWLIAVPLLPGTESFRPTATAELIGGNWTNVTSALGACIAAGASIAAHSEMKKHRKLAEATHKLMVDLHFTNTPPEV